MEKKRADFASRFRHENARMRLVSHQYRERSDVILMGVADKNRVDRSPVDRFPAGQCPLAVISGMHAAIDDEAFTTRLEIV